MLRTKFGKHSENKYSIGIIFRLSFQYNGKLEALEIIYLDSQEYLKKCIYTIRPSPFMKQAPVVVWKASIFGKRNLQSNLQPSHGCHLERCYHARPILWRNPRKASYNYWDSSLFSLDKVQNIMNSFPTI